MQLAVIILVTLMDFCYSQITFVTCSGGPTSPYDNNATNCADINPTSCRALFGRGGPTGLSPAGTRNPKCFEPALYDMALECGNTCYACCLRPEYSCGNDPASPINCTANAIYCKTSNWTSVMNKYCPGTCGTCLSGGCQDSNAGCRDIFQLCNDMTFGAYMRERCARTCNSCPSSPAAAIPATPSPSSSCSDVATNCAANRALCNVAAYSTLLTQKCAKTCGRCSSSSASLVSSCTDANSNCATWVRAGFCNNNFYTASQKRQYCARSCNLC